jgi:hypothetical protein
LPFATADQSAGDDLVDDVAGEFVGSALLGVEAVGVAKEEGAGLWAGGDGRAEAGELLRALAVLEGVQVAFGRSGAGALAATGHGFSQLLAVSR